MDKLTTYQAILVQVLKDYADPYDPENPELNDHIICDKTSGNFQLLTVGWEKNRFHYIVVFHFWIKPTGKIWLMANNTDIRIAEELIKRGVSREDIVLGFQPPSVRPFTDYATA